MYKTFGYPLAIVLCSAVSFAGSSRGGSSLNALYLPATILHVEEQATQSDYVGDSPTDAPLQAEVHTYNVSVQLSCGTYVGRYSSPFDYLPEILKSNRPVDVRFEKHVMHVKVPGEEEYTMAIIDHPRGTRQCSQR